MGLLEQPDVFCHVARFALEPSHRPDVGDGLDGKLRRHLHRQERGVAIELIDIEGSIGVAHKDLSATLKSHLALWYKICPFKYKSPFPPLTHLLK